MLVYKLPSEPSRYRASVWRKLKLPGGLPAERGGGSADAYGGSGRARRGARDPEVGARHTFCGVLSVGDRGIWRRPSTGARRRYAEVLGRCADFHPEFDKERGAGNLTFAELEENEEDLPSWRHVWQRSRARDRFGAPLFGKLSRRLNGVPGGPAAFRPRL